MEIICYQQEMQTFIKTSSYYMKAGEFITTPHDLRMKDLRYFPMLEEFYPDRLLLVSGKDDKVSPVLKTMQPMVHV